MLNKQQIMPSYNQGNVMTIKWITLVLTHQQNIQGRRVSNGENNITFHQKGQRTSIQPNSKTRMSRQWGCLWQTTTMMNILKMSGGDYIWLPHHETVNDKKDQSRWHLAWDTKGRTLSAQQVISGVRYRMRHMMTKESNSETKTQCGRKEASCKESDSCEVNNVNNIG